MIKVGSYIKTITNVKDFLGVSYRTIKKGEVGKVVNVDNLLLTNTNSDSIDITLISVQFENRIGIVSVDINEIKDITDEMRDNKINILLE